MAKNYIAFLNDESGSMHNITQAALKDYNANIDAVKNAATREMQDTIVSMFTFGGYVTREVVNSNPHVLKPRTKWRASGGTPMLESILAAVALFKSMPDYNDPEVSFVILTTTDGAYTDTRYEHEVKQTIRSLRNDERWTFAFRVPRGGIGYLRNLEVPEGNIQEWDTTAAGLEISTAQTTAAIDSFYAARSAGKKGSNVFYTSTAAVDTSKLKAVDKALYSLYIVDAYHDGAQIKDFILSKRSEYMVGGAFYQLTKTEPRVSPTKLILIRDRKTGEVFQGAEARTMLGIDTVNNARIHPNHGGGGYDIFIQSESVNRKLVKDTGVLYMPSVGRKMTQADLDRYASQKPATPVVPALPEAPATGKPTIAKKPTQVSAVVGQTAGPTVLGKPVQFFDSRSQARASGKPVKDLAEVGHTFAVGNVRNQRWFVYL